MGGRCDTAVFNHRQRELRARVAAAQSHNALAEEIGGIPPVVIVATKADLEHDRRCDTQNVYRTEISFEVFINTQHNNNDASISIRGFTI